ncbi:hypothetical protein AOLI_G00082300 [Acnodon oligacanthus]
MGNRPISIQYDEQATRLQEHSTAQEWFDEPEGFILILDHPDPCVDLESFLKNLGNSMDEETARDIMVQAVEAANQCSVRGVLHRDIKLENFHINTDTSEVKLVDFGCGTVQYCPPEVFVSGTHHAGPATVWSLGVLLFRMVCGDLPFADDEEAMIGILDFKDSLFKECCNLIGCCLKCFPSQRPSLQEIRQHEWF